MYLVEGKYNLAKWFNADGTIAANTIVEPINVDGKENHWTITDEYGYDAYYKTKVELNGRVYMQIDDGWGGESNITTTDPDTGEILYITRDESLGKDRHPMCLAKDEWWYGYGSEEGWHYIDSMNKSEKNLWKQNEEKTKWFYLDDKGKMAINKWIKSGDDWYYAGIDGHMMTNTTIKGYYLGDDWHYVATGGYMPTDATINEYYFGADGKLI